MDKMSHGNSHPGAYVLTFDLHEKIQRLAGAGIVVPDSNHDFFRVFKEETEALFRKIFPQYEIISFTTSKLAIDILSAAMSKRSLLGNALIVSTCLEITTPQDGYTLELNRLIDGDGEIIGYGPRPGKSSIEHQIRAIKHAADNRPIVLVEDGAFTGGTMVHVLKEFDRLGVQVAGIVVGFCFPEASQKISENFDGELIIIKEFESYIDWVPDHDFIPFAPNCGRVFGHKFRGRVMPVYDEHGATFSVPYLSQYCDMVECASIPEEHKGRVTMFFTRKALELYTLVQEMNEKEITIANLLAVKPRISIPISVKETNFPNMSIGVVEYLTALCHED